MTPLGLRETYSYWKSLRWFRKNAHLLTEEERQVLLTFLFEILKTRDNAMRRLEEKE